MRPSAVEAASGESVRDTINNDSTYYDHWETRYPELDPCVLDVQRKLTASATTSRVVFNLPSVDLTGCEQSQPGLHLQTYQSYTLGVYIESRCPGTDLSQYDEVSLDAFNTKNQVICPTGSAVIVNFWTQVVYTDNTATSGAGSGSGSGALSSGAITQITKSGLFGADGGPCVQTAQGALLTNDGCLVIDKTATTVAGVTTNVYYRRTMHHVSGTPTDAYYRSGTIDFSLDDWSGTLTYTAPSVAPTWVATGPNGAAASGTFTYLPYGETLGLPASPAVEGPSAATPATPRTRPCQRCRLRPQRLATEGGALSSPQVPAANRPAGLVRKAARWFSRE